MLPKGNFQGKTAGNGTGRRAGDIWERSPEILCILEIISDGIPNSAAPTARVGCRVGAALRKRNSYCSVQRQNKPRSMGTESASTTLEDFNFVDY